MFFKMKFLSYLVVSCLFNSCLFGAIPFTNNNNTSNQNPGPQSERPNILNDLNNGLDHENNCRGSGLQTSTIASEDRLNQVIESNDSKIVNLDITFSMSARSLCALLDKLDGKINSIKIRELILSGDDYHQDDEYSYNKIIKLLEEKIASTVNTDKHKLDILCLTIEFCLGGFNRHLQDISSLCNCLEKLLVYTREDGNHHKNLHYVIYGSADVMKQKSIRECRNAVNIIHYKLQSSSLKNYLDTKANIHDIEKQSKDIKIDDEYDAKLLEKYGRTVSLKPEDFMGENNFLNNNHIFIRCDNNEVVLDLTISALELHGNFDRDFPFTSNILTNDIKSLIVNENMVFLGQGSKSFNRMWNSFLTSKNIKVIKTNW